MNPEDRALCLQLLNQLTETEDPMFIDQQRKIITMINLNFPLRDTERQELLALEERLSYPKKDEH